MKDAKKFKESIKTYIEVFRVLKGEGRNIAINCNLKN